MKVFTMAALAVTSGFVAFAAQAQGRPPEITRRDTNPPPPEPVAESAAGATTPSHATGFYLNLGLGGYGEADGNDDDYKVSTDTASLRLGWQFNPSVGIEAEASSSIGDGEIQDTGVDGDFRLKSTLGAYLKLGGPVSRHVNMFARLGYRHEEGEVEIGGLKASGSEDFYAVGGGLEVDLSAHNGLRFDITAYIPKGYDRDTFDVVGAAVDIAYVHHF
jgi:hypothetical protein